MSRISELRNDMNKEPFMKKEISTVFDFLSKQNIIVSLILHINVKYSIKIWKLKSQVNQNLCVSIISKITKTGITSDILIFFLLQTHHHCAFELSTSKNQFYFILRYGSTFQ